MVRELSGTAEAAELIGGSRNSIKRLLSDDPTFPRPVAVLTSDRVWETKDLKRWVSKRRWSLERKPREPSELAGNSHLAIRRAYVAALRLGHKVVDVDHLWLALSDPDVKGPAMQILGEFGVDAETLERAISAQSGRVAKAKQRSVPEPDELPVSTRARVTLVRALYYVAELHDEQIDSRHLLLALLDEWQKDSISHYLELNGLHREPLRTRASEWIEARAEPG